MNTFIKCRKRRNSLKVRRRRLQAVDCIGIHRTANKAQIYDDSKENRKQEGETKRNTRDEIAEQARDVLVVRPMKI